MRRCRSLPAVFLPLALLIGAATSGCAGQMTLWKRPPTPQLSHGEHSTAQRHELQQRARFALRRARSVGTSAERVVWYGRAAIAQYRLARGRIPLDTDLLRDDPTGMVAVDIIDNADDLERRHHPHLFDCQTWLKQVDATRQTPIHRAWAAHCAFRVAEIRSYIVRELGLPETFDGTMPRRLQAMGRAIDRATEALAQTQKLAERAGDDAILLASFARLVMLNANFAIAIARVPLPEAYNSAPATADLLRSNQMALAMPFAARARHTLRLLNRMAADLRRHNDPWVKAARAAVLKAPR